MLLFFYEKYSIIESTKVTDVTEHTDQIQKSPVCYLVLHVVLTELTCTLEGHGVKLTF